MEATQPLVRVEGLKKYFPLTQGLFSRAQAFVHAVDDVSFEIRRGESVALVGESGSGKTTTGKLLVRLLDPTEGHIYLRANGSAVDVATLSGATLKSFRRDVQMIFQDPFESLNPRRTIFDTISEPLSVQGIGNVLEREERVAEMLAAVGLAPPTSFMFRFPHELSGGQRQRVAIARALVINPAFVVADEPTSMLDVSIRTAGMALMQQLADHLGVTYLYITHDLAVARYMSQKIAVMYMGKIVELGETEEVLQNPQHPYTRALLSAVPVPDPTIKRQPPEIAGSIAKPVNPAPVCRFIDRCPMSAEVCRENPHPPLEDKGGGHYAACHRI
ncbi:MAG TPA: oligopeptide/dipeptide ABC transporter ATP-binding protein [Ardenticatenaceae bacterium]|nr:oligopeptide/dipeptide ABC transporter ATP-binding protein [Ardenticatenaceae bacterium]